MAHHDMDMSFERALDWTFTCSRCGRSTDDIHEAALLERQRCKGPSERRGRLSWLFGIFAAIVALVPATTASARSCDRLSYERNLIFKENGYCFKTSRQIAIFGNAGCQYDNQEDVPLTARERKVLSDIIQDEREAGCR